MVVLSSSTDGDPVAVRVRSVTTTGFELVQVEPGGEDGPHGPVEVHYLAVEPGEHILMDGTRIGAGFVMTTAVQHGTGVVGSRSWDSITFGTSFGSPPVLVAGLQTTANETAAIPGSASEPWLVVAVQGVTASGAEVALERSESAPGEVMGPETIGWVAIEAGVMTTLEANDGSPVGLESLLTATEISGLGQRVPARSTSRGPTDRRRWWSATSRRATAATAAGCGAARWTRPGSAWPPTRTGSATPSVHTATRSRGW